MNSLLDKRSEPAGKSEVELFTLPPTQVAIERGYWVETFLKHTITDNGPFEFQIPPTASYIDLAKNYIFMEISISKLDGTNADENVGPINALGKTLFKQVKVYLNNKLCMDSGDSYAFISYLETELNYGNDAKTTHLETALYERDKSDYMDAKTNPSWAYRASLLLGGRRVQMMAPIHCDLFNQDKLLLSHMDVRLELHRNSDAFCLMSWDKTNQYKINIHKMSWFVRKVDLAPSLALGLERCLNQETAKYPIRRMLCKSMNIDTGSRDTPNLILTNGQIPRRVILTFVEKNSFFGDFTKNPFNFKPFNVREITVTAGSYTFPRNPIEMDFDNRRYVHGYVTLMEALNIANNDKGNSLTLAEFGAGYFFYAIDLTPDSSDGTFWELVQEGTCSVRVVFRSDLTKDIKMLCFCEFDNLLTIDRNRNVFTDYTA